MAVREWGVWQKDILNDHDYEKRKSTWWAPFLPALFMLGVFTFGPLVAIITLASIVVGTNAIWWGVPELGRISPLYGLNSHGWHGDPMRRLGEQYLSHTKEDRREYPHDFLEIIKDPLLTKKQKDELTNTFTALHKTINERNHQREQLSRRYSDISGALEFARQNRDGIEEETRTLKELA